MTLNFLGKEYSTDSTAEMIELQLVLNRLDTKLKEEQKTKLAALFRPTYASSN
jgi:membrane protein insertase Oxa1/YidC/SpoIIIJ